MRLFFERLAFMCAAGAFWGGVAYLVTRSAGVAVIVFSVAFIVAWFALGLFNASAQDGRD